jgi:hypothetical protein
MCFNGYMSAGFAAVGLYAAWWIHSKTNNRMLASGVFFFFTMEFLQAIQYLYLATGLNDPLCETILNKVLTMIGFIHICLQPYFCHVINESLCHFPKPGNEPEHNKKLEKYHNQYTIIKRLCLLGGFLLWLRYPLSFVPEWSTTLSQPSTEWLRGEKLCTFKTQTMVHLGWSVPMADPTYNIMGAGIHSFLMFAPFFAMYDKKGMVLQGLVLYFTGPALAAAISPNLMEQASIWCFFSIAQISIMLFLIREVILVNWGKQGSSLTSIDGASSNKKQKITEAATPASNGKKSKNN